MRRGFGIRLFNWPWGDLQPHYVFIRADPADHAQVEAGVLDNSLLTIPLKIEIPEAMKPRRIPNGGTAESAGSLQIDADFALSSDARHFLVVVRAERTEAVMRPFVQVFLGFRDLAQRNIGAGQEFLDLNPRPARQVVSDRLSEMRKG